MKENHTIRRSLAFALLLVFLFGITPKKYLHDVFAGHEDISYSSSGEQAMLYKAGFQCGFHQLVTESPYADLSLPIHFSSPPLPASRYQSHHFFMVPGTACVTDNKGPPALPSA